MAILFSADPSDLDRDTVFSWICELSDARGRGVGKALVAGIL
jgi:hypothetical protein